MLHPSTFQERHHTNNTLHSKITLQNLHSRQHSLREYQVASRPVHRLEHSASAAPGLSTRSQKRTRGCYTIKRTLILLGTMNCGVLQQCLIGIYCQNVCKADKRQATMEPQKPSTRTFSRSFGSSHLRTISTSPFTFQAFPPCTAEDKMTTQHHLWLCSSLQRGQNSRQYTTPQYGLLSLHYLPNQPMTVVSTDISEQARSIYQNRDVCRYRQPA